MCIRDSLETKALLAGSTGQPLLEQALHAATQVVDLEGVELDESGRMLTEALIRAERRGQPNIFGFLRELPGEQASIDLSRLAEVANRLKTNLEGGCPGPFRRGRIRDGCSAGASAA